MNGKLRLTMIPCLFLISLNREEFALFGSHYCLLVAQTGSDLLIPEQQRSSRRASVDSVATEYSDMSTRTVSPHKDSTQWFAYKHSATVEKERWTHHGSAYKIANQDALGLHGGVGLRGRMSATSVYTHSDTALTYPATPPENIEARCAHTITSFGSFLQYNLLVGGRASPSAPMKDCWLQMDGKWQRVHDLPEPRFRHRAAAVVLPHDQYGVIVYGGKTSSTRIAIDTLVWDKHNGWRVLHNVKDDPMPRFGASFVRIGFNHGLLMGGLRQDGVVCQGLWKWRLIIRDNTVKGIWFKTSTALDASAGMWPWLNRFGASYSVIRDELLLIGGVAKLGCIPKDYEILSVVGSFSAFSEHEKEMELRVVCVLPKLDAGVPRPFLIGHSSHYTAQATTLIVGGGATCFSFGAYWNPGCWLLHDRHSGPSSHWAIVKPETARYLPQLPPPGYGSPPHTFSYPINVININSDQDFVRILQEGHPRLIGALDFGSCLFRWKPSHLLEKIPPSKAIVIHAASTRNMNFRRKDFAYQATTFHAFINHLQSDPSSHLYLRSISSTNPSTTPADFSTDWPEIASDFHIPPPLSFVDSNQHSSPLRISANVNMWLHYDVMANVLFQIRGTRKLILFPPRDLKHLSFPSGSTSSTIDIFQPADQSPEEDSIRSIPNTHPHVAILRPGEVLYIPPLWAHTGTPLCTPRRTTNPSSTNASTQASSTAPSSTPSSVFESKEAAHSPSTTTTLPNSAEDQPLTDGKDSANSYINISINVFFRTLSPQKYQAGRDVYGNRDLAAYEDGRRNVDKIVRRFLATSSQKPNGATNSAAEAANGDDASKVDPKSVELDMDSIPKDIVKAYLERLACELQERADKL